MSRRRGISFGPIAAAIVVLAGAVFAVLGQGCGDDADTTKPSAAEPIVIGVSLGLTNRQSTKGVPAANGIRVAEGAINAAGGVLGRPLRFDIVDDASDEGEGVARVARDFADRKVAAVIGPLGSVQVRATQQILAQRKILQITPSAAAPDLAQIQPPPDRFLFRTVAADDLQAAAMMLVAIQTPPVLTGGDPLTDDAGTAISCTQLALAHLDDDVGNAMARVVIEKFPPPGKVTAVKLPVEAASYGDAVASLLAANPGCIGIIADDRVGAQVVKDLRANPGFADAVTRGVFVIGSDGLFTKPFLDLTLADPADQGSASSAIGLYGTNADIPFKSPEYLAFRALYTSWYPLPAGEDVPPFAANAFDAAVLAAFAIQKAGRTEDRVAVRDALKAVSAPDGVAIGPANVGAGLQEIRGGGDIDYTGASGPLDFEENGNVANAFLVWHIDRDKQSNRVVFQVVTRFESAALVDLVK